MKFKYKKIILGITMGTMAIGLVTLSVSNKNSSSTTNVEKVIEATGSADVSLTATIPIATPDVLTAGLKQDAYPEVNELVKKYFAASVKGDVDALAQIVSESDKIDKSVLEKKYEYIEDMKNISCYTIDGAEEGSYIAYVYYEVKFVDIDTLAPGMIRLYVCTAEDGSLSIFISAVDDEIQNYIDQSANNPQVVELIRTVNTKLEEALSSDKKLKDFNDKLEESAKLAQENAEATKAPKATKAPETAK